MRALVVAFFGFAVVTVPACSSFTPDEEEEEEEEEEEGPCDGDRDCRGGERCVEGACRPICDDVDRPCPEGQQCVDGACIPDEEQLCTPGSIGCLDDATAFVCSADGLEQTAAPCREDQICIDGVCKAQVCEPSSTTCSGSALVTCNADGTERTVTSCDDACDGDLGFGCGCIAAACAPRTCEPNSARCVGNSAQVCDAFGSAFGDLADCGSNSCFAGRCLPDNCTAGETFCSGTTLLTCDVDGVGYDETSCAEACDNVDGVATCTERVCTPLEATCADDDTLVQCNAQGTEEQTVPCGSRRFCRDGLCEDEVCEPNSRTCAGNSVVTCDALGANETATPCGGDQACQNGQCVDDTCVPDCSGRECGLDPVCGVSCGSCAGTCDSQGQCTVADGPVMTVEVSWTPTSSDIDLYVSRTVDAASMCSADTCYFATCQQADPRPDWDDSGGISDGDPLLDVVNIQADNPEIARVPLPATAQGYRVGAHVFAPSTGTATTVATVRIRLDGALVTTHTRAISPDDLWQGVVVSWDGAALSSNDDGTAAVDFECGDNPPNGDTCVSDADCQEGFACDQTGLFGGSGQCIVGCRSNADCGATQECNAVHDCVLASSVVEWKEACENNSQCEVGFHCDFLTQRCEEECTVGCNPSTDAGCCELSGGSQCTPDPFFQVFGNCDV